MFIWKPDGWSEKYIQEYMIPNILIYNELPTTTNKMYERKKEAITIII